jgi:DHA2 family multidrug resistance protein
VLGPTLGGWITDNISWHWIFLINVPVGILSLFLVHTLVTEPEVIEKERAARLKKGLNVDFIGFILIALGLGCLELTLDRGERDDWFSSPFICATAIVSALSIVCLIFWERSRKDPVMDVRLLGQRNFGIATTFMLTTGLVLFSTTAIIPQMLQQVFGYNATNAGLAMTTGGLATLITMPIVGQLAGRVDARFLLIPALLLQALALYYMSHWNSGISFGEASFGRMISAAGLPFLFIPISTVAYVGLKPTQTNQASALLNVARNIGGSIGISAAQSLVIERGQVHQSRIVETLSPLNPNYVQGLDQIHASLPGSAGDGSDLGVLMNQVVTQAQMLAFVDLFRIFMWVVLIIVPLGLFLHSGKGQSGGAH